jgi:hypothetical protein
MNRQEMTDALVEWYIESMLRDLAIEDYSFFDAVLRGDGWVPFDQLTDEQLKEEWEAME